MGVGLFLNILTTPLHTQKCFNGGGGLQKYIDHPTQTHKNGLMGDGIGVYKNILTTPVHTIKNVLMGVGVYKKYIDHPTQTHKNGLMGDGGL